MKRLTPWMLPALLSFALLPACGDDGGDGDGDGDTTSTTGTETDGGETGTESTDGGDGDTSTESGGDGDTGTEGDTGGDGDGSTGGDGDGDAGDALAEIACGEFQSGETTSVMSVMTQADANQVVLTPSMTDAYMVTLNEDPEGGYVGWVNMSVPDWGSTQAIFVGPGVEYELFRSEGMSPISKDVNAACPDTNHTDERIFFPHWDDAQVRFNSTDQSEVWFMFFKQD